VSKGLDTRERIIDRAMAIASRDGFDGLSIGALAADLKLSKSGLFGHFESKEDLQLQVLEKARANFRADVLEPAEALSPGEPQIRKVFEGWLNWASSRRLFGGCVLIAAAHEFDDKPGPQRDKIEASQRTLLKNLQRMTQAAIDAGQFRADLDVQQFSHDLYAMVVGYQQLIRLMRDRQLPTRVRTSFEQLLAAAHR
jgi:AcrR family transcriptional regulator